MDSSLSDFSGFRSDVSDHLKALRLGVLRWPGGNFASSYHFADGIGPKEDRPRRVDLAWGGDEPNHFGTDEFLAYCDKIATEPYICLNMGTGTLDEALAWIETPTLRGRLTGRSNEGTTGASFPMVFRCGLSEMRCTATGRWRALGDRIRERSHTLGAGDTDARSQCQARELRNVGLERVGSPGY